MNPVALAAPDSRKPAIYSPRAVLGFSMLFSALAGGVLTFSSLRAVGRPAAARRALLVSLGWLALTVGLAEVLPFWNSGLSIGLGLGGGSVLNYLLKQQVPDEADHPRKSIIKPLIICLLLTVPVLYFAIKALLAS